MARTVIVVLVVLLAAAVLFVGYKLLGLFFTDFRGSGEVVIVPDTIGKPIEEAETELKDRKLIPVIQRRHSDKQPAGLVFQQEPSPRSKIKQGHKVTLFESLGQATFVVPDLIGRDIGAVPEVLRDSNLALGTITKVFIPGQQTGEIVNQSPRAGHELSSSTQVDIVVIDNENITNTTMPEVIGSQLYPAEERLARLNLRLAKVTYVADDTVDGGTVIAQDVAAESEVPVGTPIELTVALPTSVIEKPVKTVKIHIPITSGPEDQPVKIKVFDNLGGSVPYEANHSPGDRVDRALDVEGPTKIYIFVNDMHEPFREEIIP